MPKHQGHRRPSKKDVHTGSDAETATDDSHKSDATDEGGGGHDDDAAQSRRKSRHSSSRRKDNKHRHGDGSTSSDGSGSARAMQVTAVIVTTPGRIIATVDISAGTVRAD